MKEQYNCKKCKDTGIYFIYGGIVYQYGLHIKYFYREVKCDCISEIKQ